MAYMTTDTLDTLSAEEALTYCNGILPTENQWSSTQIIYFHVKQGRLTPVDFQIIAENFEKGGYSQAAIARVTGLSVNTIQRYLAGTHRSHEILRFYRKDLDELVRTVLGLPPYNAPKELSEKVINLLGQRPDKELAKEAGVSPKTISRRREAMNIPSYASLKRAGKSD